MKNYTDADVLAYWDAHLGVQESRKREYTDPRNYILTLLHFKFGYIEEELGEIFGVHRSSINHAKRLPYDHMEFKDKDFLEHTEELVEKFPYIFPKPGDVEPTKLYSVNLKLTKKELTSLKKYATAKNRRINQAGADIVNSYLRKWDV